MAKHTPGPWIIRRNQYKIISIAHQEVGGGYLEVASIPGCFITEEEQEANARLVKAAPALHEAAVIALFVLGHITPVKTHEGTEGEEALEKAITLLTDALAESAEKK